MDKNITIVRQGHMAEKIVIVDGQAGCGKTMLSPIIAALERVELLTYAYELEHICSLRFLDHITQDGAVAMARMLTDLQLYNAMMARETNVRPGDLSSIFSDVDPWKYARRLLQKGDEHVPLRIRQERPILHLTTHNLFPMAGPVFEALGQRVLLVEVVRHPLRMLKQQALNMTNLVADARDFTIYYDYKGRQLPFFVRGIEDIFMRSNDVEKAIYCIDHLTRKADAWRMHASEQTLTIPFERFVLDPDPYMEQLCTKLQTRITSATRRMMRKQKVPRQRIADGAALPIYKRCGWTPLAEGANDQTELANHRAFAQANASAEAMAVLDRLSVEYERKYLRQDGS